MTKSNNKSVSVFSVVNSFITECVVMCRSRQPLLVYWWRLPGLPGICSPSEVHQVKGPCWVEHVMSTEQTNWGQWKWILFIRKDFFNVSLHFTGEALKMMSPPSHRHFHTQTADGDKETNVSPNSNDPERLCWLWFRVCYFCFKLRLALWPGALCFLKGCRV